MAAVERGIVQVAILLVFSYWSPGAAQSRERGPWWPHPAWGSKDQAGASNWITPEKVLRATRLVRTGHLYELGHVYERGMPLYGNRSFALMVPVDAGEAYGTNAIVGHDDFFAGQIGQVGTQFDGLGHVGRRLRMADGSMGDVFYNGFTRGEMWGDDGLRALGVEQVRPIITRGILIDIAGYKGVPTLTAQYQVTLADVRASLSRQKLHENAIETGDAILFNLGWAHNWNNPSRYNDGRIGVGENNGSPGIGLEVARWLAEQNVALVGADVCCVEVDPNPDPSQAYPVHQELLMRNGIFILENLDLRSLAMDGVYEFLFVATPLRLKGATGSPVRPLAIR